MHLNIYNIIYGQKKGRKSKCQFDSQPLKVGNHPDLLVFKWCATYHWKALEKGYNFTLDLTWIKGLHKKLWASKVARVLILGISGLNHIWMQPPWPSIKNIVKGKVVASPKFRPWWVLWVYVCQWFIRAPKVSNYALTNLLFGLRRSIWIIDPLVTRPSPHPRALARPFYSQSVSK
jgi:hypothetical protein